MLPRAWHSRVLHALRLLSKQRHHFGIPSKYTKKPTNNVSILHHRQHISRKTFVFKWRNVGAAIRDDVFEYFCGDESFSYGFMPSLEAMLLPMALK